MLYFWRTVYVLAIPLMGIVAVMMALMDGIFARTKRMARGLYKKTGWRHKA